MSTDAPSTARVPSGRREPARNGFRDLIRCAQGIPLLVRVGDAGAAVGAALGALWVWSRVGGNAFTFAFVYDRAAWFLLAAAWVAVLGPTHRSPAALSTNQTVALVVRGLVTVAGLYMAIYFLAPRDLLPRLVVLSFLALAGAMTLAWRAAHRHLSTSDAHRVPVAVVGAGTKARALAQLVRETAPHKKIVAFVDAGPRSGPVAPLAAPVIAAPELSRLAADRQVSEMFLAPDGAIGPEVLRSLVRAQEERVAIVPLHTAYEQLLERLPIRHLDGSSVLASLAHADGFAPAPGFVHRFIDLAAGCVGCAALLALLPIIGSAVWLDVGRPVFFLQERVGLAGRRFRLVKFRTMPHDAEPDGPRWARDADPRASWFGRLLRRCHLDEMPQFWNVLRGEMSLVGPRPERPEFVDDLVRRIPCYRERLLVRPGLTGWAQINYRYGSSVEDAMTKLEYDLYYIKHRSPWFDALIAWRTLWTLVTFSGR